MEGATEGLSRQPFAMPPAGIAASSAPFPFPAATLLQMPLLSSKPTCRTLAVPCTRHRVHVRMSYAAPSVRACAVQTVPYTLPYRGLLTEYYTLDYARAFDALQLRIAVMRNSLKVNCQCAHYLW